MCFRCKQQTMCGIVKRFYGGSVVECRARHKFLWIDPDNDPWIRQAVVRAGAAAWAKMVLKGDAATPQKNRVLSKTTKVTRRIIL